MPSAARDQLFGIDKQILRFAQNDDTAKPSGFVRRSKPEARYSATNGAGNLVPPPVLPVVDAAAGDQYPFFPSFVFGSLRDADIDDDELTPNQLEIVLAIQSKSRAAMAEEVQALLGQIGDLEKLKGKPKHLFTRTMVQRLRDQYVPMIGWLAWSFKLHATSERNAPDAHGWRQLGLEALGSSLKCEQQDRVAWDIAEEERSKNPLAQATARVAAADEMIKRLIVVAEGDIEHYFIQPALSRIRYGSRPGQRAGIEFGTIQRSSILATNRLVARVDNNASSDLLMDAPTDFLQQATQLAQLTKGFRQEQINQGLTSGALGAAGSRLAGTNLETAFGIGGILGLLGSLSALPPDPPGEVYSISSGNLFKVTPIFDPSGQALRFRFDLAALARVREPDGTINPQIPRVERHTINTEVQLSNFELREISRYETNSRLGMPTRKYGGIPFLKELPFVKDIPLLGYFVKSGGQKATRQESIVLAQSTIYPSIAEVIDVLVESASRPSDARQPPDYLQESDTTATAIRPAARLIAITLPEMSAGGSAVDGTVLLNQAVGTDGIDVKLTSGDTSVVLPSPMVYIRPGECKASFRVVLPQVQSTKQVAITASAGHESRQASILVNPVAPVALQSVQLTNARPMVGETIVAVLTLTRVDPNDNQEIILSADSAILEVPPVVVIRKGNIATSVVMAARRPGVTVVNAALGNSLVKVRVSVRARPMSGTKTAGPH